MLDVYQQCAEERINICERGGLEKPSANQSAEYLGLKNVFKLDDNSALI